MASLSPVAPTAINPIPYTAPAPLPHPQILLVLAGVVGSGKSTLAHAIAAQLPVRPSPSSPPTYPNSLVFPELVKGEPR